ncbi:unnamed protein product, partial [Urochloa humidicola]
QDNNAAASLRNSCCPSPTPTTTALSSRRPRAQRPCRRRLARGHCRLCSVHGGAPTPRREQDSESSLRSPPTPSPRTTRPQAHSHQVYFADSSKTSSKWAEFAARVSGEWDGFGADFTAGGDPVELPENVVPEAYRDWGVQVFDWQTQCPTFADPATPCALHYRLVRLLPTVGCEADAATVHTSHRRHASSASAFAYAAAAGSYVAAWPRGPAPVLEVEHCVARPGNAQVRVRVVQTVALGKEPRLRGIKVFSEQWYGPFRNGEQLGGCAVRDTAFAAGEKLDVSEVLGEWVATEAAAARFSDELDPETGKFAELSPDEPSKVVRDADGVVALPKQLWSVFKELGDGEFLCEVGWALGGGSAVTSRCVLSKDGDVKEIVAAYESRVSESRKAPDSSLQLILVQDDTLIWRSVLSGLRLEQKNVSHFYAGISWFK